MTKEQSIRRAEESRDILSNVEVLAFCEVESPTSMGRYHVFGAYRRRSDGRICIRRGSSDFAVRLPRNARELWLSEPWVSTGDYCDDPEAENARDIAQRWSGLPEPLASFVSRAQEAIAVSPRRNK